MNLTQNIKHISYLKAKTADVINNVKDTLRTVIIDQDKMYDNLEKKLF